MSKDTALNIAQLRVLKQQAVSLDYDLAMYGIQIIHVADDGSFNRIAPADYFEPPADPKAS